MKFSYQLRGPLVPLGGLPIGGPTRVAIRPSLKTISGTVLLNNLSKNAKVVFFVIRTFKITTSAQLCFLDMLLGETDLEPIGLLTND